MDVGQYGWKGMLQAVLHAAVLFLIVATLFALQQMGVLDPLPLPGHAGQLHAIDGVGAVFYSLLAVALLIIVLACSSSCWLARHRVGLLEV